MFAPSKQDLTSPLKHNTQNNVWCFYVEQASLRVECSVDLPERAVAMSSTACLWLVAVSCSSTQMVENMLPIVFMGSSLAVLQCFQINIDGYSVPRCPCFLSSISVCLSDFH